jgi:hypothetical protein
VCRNCHNLSTLKIPPAEFAKSRLLRAAAEATFVREKQLFFWPWHSKLQTLVGTLLFRLLIVKIGLDVRVKVNISWIIDKSYGIRII